MRANKSARKSAIEVLGDGVDVVAVILVSPSLGDGKAVGFRGGAKANTSVFSTDYAVDLGLDPDGAGMRSELHPGWITLTADELIFHEPGLRGLRPGPTAVLDRCPKARTTLSWFDLPVKGLTTRVLHLRLADGSELLTATAYRPASRRKPFDDEADAFVEAFGDAATHRC